MRQGEAPDFLKELPSSIREAWKAVLVACHMRRHRRCHITTWNLSDDAKKLWADFHEEILRDVSVFAPFSLPWFRWLPELMMRLALLLSVLRPFTERDAEERRTVEADVVHRACVLTRWLAGEHLECLRSLHRSHPVNEVPESDDCASIDTIDDKALEEAILEKLLKKGPLSRRELTRSFHKMPVLDLEGALKRLIRAGLVCETKEGRLQVAPSKSMDCVIR